MESKPALARSGTARVDCLPFPSRSSVLLTPRGPWALQPGRRSSDRGASGTTPGGAFAWEPLPGVGVFPAERTRERILSFPGGIPITTQRQPEVRVNERIRVPQVRVIGDDGEQIGVLAVREALTLAQSKGLDLVDVSPPARPPVCRIMDYGKFKYEQNRRARKAKKKQHQMQLKEIKMRPKIEGHDYDFKLQHARAFLEGRDKVKLTVTFRGREMRSEERRAGTEGRSREATCQ